MDIKRCNWHNESIRHKTNWPGFDTFSFSVKTQIYLLGLGMFGRTPNSLMSVTNPENFLLTLRDANDYLLANNHVSVEHDGSSKIYEVFYEKPILLDAKSVYHLRIARNRQSEMENFIGIGKKLECNVDGVIFEKENYFRESNVISCILFQEKQK